MSNLLCKMCGGILNTTEEDICECEYCGTRQTFLKADDERILTLYNKANKLRQQGVFDRAEHIFEKIISEKPTDPEAHWALLLCRFGIEYVEDSNTFKHIPTCHRPSYDSILNDIDYMQAIKYADPSVAEFYKNEAVYIDKIQGRILEISRKEKPFDIFICYKETDFNGNRTLDSMKAQEIYYALTDKGYNVFFSRITLEGKLGQFYEPYIFSALNSAKIMLVIGTDPDFVNAAWVKNEWSRFLKIMATKKDRILIPCYLNMSPYELPNEFSYLQGQDMSKIGFLQDLLYGINKIIPAKNKKVSSTQFHDNRVEGLIKCITLSIEESDWNKANDFCSQMITTNPSSIIPYIYKLYIAHQSNKDILESGKKLNNISSEITAEEKQLINETNYQIYFLAFLRGRCLTRAKYIIEKYPDIYKATYLYDNCATSALNCAVSVFKDIFMLQTLLKWGFNPNKSFRYLSKTTRSNKYTPLNDAIWKSKNAEMVKILLESGADPNRIETLSYNNGSLIATSELSNAICNANSVEIVKLLLEHGADPKTSFRRYNNKYGQTIYSALSDAIWNAKNVEIVQLLLEHGADANTITDIVYDDGLKGARSMLSEAIVSAKSVEMVSLLLEHNADPNQSYRIYTNKYGQTKYMPLSDAIWNAQNIEIVKLLLNHGAKADFVENIIFDSGNNGAKSMLTYAIVDAKSKEMVELLLQYGATWDHTITYNGKTRLERKYPYQKIVSKDFAKFLKTCGWQGSLL